LKNIYTKNKKIIENQNSTIKKQESLLDQLKQDVDLLKQYQSNEYATTNEIKELKTNLLKKEEELQQALKLLDNMNLKLNDLSADNTALYEKYKKSLQQLDLSYSKQNESSKDLQSMEAIKLSFRKSEKEKDLVLKAIN